MGAQPPALCATEGARLRSGADAGSVREVRERWNSDLPVRQQRVSAGQPTKAIARTVSGSENCRSAASRFRRITPTEKAQIVKHIRGSGAQLVFAGLGCPRQEVWAYEFHDALSMPVVAVGAAFDFHAGTIRQAPPRLQRAGLEWAYRLSREPRRLWRRYALLNPLYVAMVTAQATGLRRFGENPGTRPQEEMFYG